MIQIKKLKIIELSNFLLFINNNKIIGYIDTSKDYNIRTILHYLPDGVIEEFNNLI